MHTHKKLNARRVRALVARLFVVARGTLWQQNVTDLTSATTNNGGRFRDYELCNHASHTPLSKIVMDIVRR